MYLSSTLGTHEPHFRRPVSSVPGVPLSSTEPEAAMNRRDLLRRGADMALEDARLVRFRANQRLLQ
jgi:hypothetical protein